MQNILDLNAKLCKYNEKGKNNSLIDIWSKVPIRVGSYSCPQPSHLIVYNTG